jgi:tetratricopeptide (TPR) repeat protein
MSSNSAAVPLTELIEVFYSYSHKDEKLRDKLEDHLSALRNQGVIANWHDRKITAGTEWEGQINEHINSAHIILLLISSSFLASKYCYDVEMNRAMERHNKGEAQVITIILRPVDWKGSPFAKLQFLPKDARPIIKWPTRDEGFENVALGIRKVVEELCSPRNVTKAPTLLKSPPIWNLTHRQNPNFTGREDLLRSLHEALTSGKSAALTQVIHGLGGVGKTQTAIEYAYRHQNEYNLIWWIRSEEPATLAADYAALAEPLQLQERDAQDQTSITKAVHRALAQRSGWLLIFDNAESPEQIEPYLSGTGHVLVTSRNPAFGGVAHPLQVEEMRPNEAVELLLKRAARDQNATTADREAAAELAQELGCLPLALNQAAAYVDATAADFASYLRLFRTQQKERLKDGRNLGRDERTIDGTWELAIKMLEKLSPAAAQLMNVCAFLAPDDIPRDILQAGKQYLPEPLSQAVADESHWNDAMQALRRYSLAERSAEVISVHRLVQAVVRARLNQAAEKEWAVAAVSVVNDAFPFKEEDLQTWTPSARLLPHALASSAYGEQLQVAVEQRGRLLNNVGLYLRERAEFKAAKEALERSLAAGETAYGPNHSVVATRLSNLGLVLDGMGDYYGARAHHERALKIHEATLDPNDPRIAVIASNLGTVLRSLGDFSGARAHLERALRISEAAFGPDHPQVGTSLNNLGLVLEDSGDLERAQGYFERALKIAEATYGPDHPHVSIRLNNLGLLLLRLNDFSGGRALLERAVKIDEASYGTSHPQVARRLHSLGLALKRLGDLEGARAHYERALQIDETAFGPSHPDVAVDLNNLGRVLQDLGDSSIARVYYERARKIVEQTQGPDHPNSKTVRENIESLGR